ncbi:hypothetical protein N7466_005409 [Penicillium verhagenii]|uniref:uncharacterized protein n=1 Tax=Penicillium verhagenii TaxID=1562060 RepID=UPI002545BDB3|nr:uncharacterized protein N7466_005409 [Penicillium verhagenii]KAJ5929916.1 hypothetical protein N7466_005409 [Penicillium verhagenii]
MDDQTIIVRDVEKAIFNTEVNGPGSDGYQSPTLVASHPLLAQSLLPKTSLPGHRSPSEYSRGAKADEVRRFANPAPLGLCAFALTSFVSNSTHVYVTDIPSTGVTLALPLVYGGVVQLIAGIWEMAVGNTFGATSFCSYGAYWITSGVMSIVESMNSESDDTCGAETLMGVFMMAWFIFTTLMLLGTIRSSLAMFLLFFFLDMNYLLLGIAHLKCHSDGQILASAQKVGGVFGLLAAASAWWNALAGVVDKNTCFFTIPLGHFPWSPAARINRTKVKNV